MHTRNSIQCGILRDLRPTPRTITPRIAHTVCDVLTTSRRIRVQRTDSTIRSSIRGLVRAGGARAALAFRSACIRSCVPSIARAQYCGKTTSWRHTVHLDFTQLQSARCVYRYPYIPRRSITHVRAQQRGRHRPIFPVAQLVNVIPSLDMPGSDQSRRPFARISDNVTVADFHHPL